MIRKNEKANKFKGMYEIVINSMHRVLGYMDAYEPDYTMIREYLVKILYIRKEDRVLPKDKLTKLYIDNPRNMFPRRPLMKQFRKHMGNESLYEKTVEKK